MTNFSHIPVLLNEAVDELNVSKSKKYIDATLGGGGHTLEIVKRGGIVLGIDQDEEAIEFVAESQKSVVSSQKLKIVKGNFADIAKIANDNAFGKVDGILFDLGVSSYQLDSEGRGFSLRKDEKLDMRMDKSQKTSAYDVVNTYPLDDLIEIFYKYGEEHNARIIAGEIVARRKKGEIGTTKELSDIIAGLPHKNEPINPATRVFQAIRIEVNGELEALRKGLTDSLDILNPHGRIAVISFHSLEDRIVKQMFEKFKNDNMGTIITKKPIMAGFVEVKQNKRSHSAKLRVFQNN